MSAIVVKVKDTYIINYPVDIRSTFTTLIETDHGTWFVYKPQFIPNVGGFIYNLEGVSDDEAERLIRNS